VPAGGVGKKLRVENPLSFRERVGVRGNLTPRTLDFGA
jgi:hypothetical protein